MSFHARLLMSASLPPDATPVTSAFPLALPWQGPVPRLETWDTCLSWRPARLRGVQVDEVVDLTVLGWSPGRRRELRDPGYPFGWLQRLTALTGGFGLGVLEDPLEGLSARAMYFAGRTLEYRVRRGELDEQGRVAAADLSPTGNQEVFARWVQGTFGLAPEDLEAGLRRRASPATCYWTGEVPDRLPAPAGAPEPPLTLLAAFADAHSWRSAVSAMPLPPGARAWRRAAPARLTLSGIRPPSVEAVLALVPALVPIAWLDAFMRHLRCDAAAAHLVAPGAVVPWWDWRLGVPAHGGQVSGAAEFLEIWQPLAEALGTSPWVLTAPPPPLSR